MKWINLAFYGMVLLLALIVLNHLLRWILLPGWFSPVVTVLAALLFFIRMYNRLGKR